MDVLISLQGSSGEWINYLPNPEELPESYSHQVMFTYFAEPNYYQYILYASETPFYLFAEPSIYFNDYAMIYYYESDENWLYAGASAMEIDFSEFSNMEANAPIYTDSGLTEIYLNATVENIPNVIIEASAYSICPNIINSTSYIPVTNYIENFNYELSLWTHQDEFIRLLKGEIEFKGQAYNVMYTKNIDGDESLNFSIPLHIYSEETNGFIANPLWSLIKNEKKIRLIRNKKITNETISDFVIKSFVEKKENTSVTIDVECKSYNYYELKFIGNSLTLSDNSDVGIVRSKLPPLYFKNNTIWIDYSNTLYVYDETTDTWVIVPKITPTIPPYQCDFPTDAVEGDVWINPGTGVTYIWENEAWSSYGSALLITVTDNDNWDNAFIYKSLDNGITWAHKYTYPNFSWWQSKFLSLGSGIVLNKAEEYIYRSINYGETWQLVYTMTEGSDCKTMISEGNGEVYSLSYEKLYQSMDYGATWSEIGVTPQRLAGDDENNLEDFLSFSNGIFILLGSSNIYKTVDYGESYTLISKEVAGLTTGASATSWIYGIYDQGTGQSFFGNGGKLLGASFYLSKLGSPPFNLYAKLYSHSGTYGSTGVPNVLLATSNSIAANSLSTSATKVDFTFSGDQQYQLGIGSYFIVCETDFTGDTLTDRAMVSYNTNGGYAASGNRAYKWNNNWSYDSYQDLLFTLTTETEYQGIPGSFYRLGSFGSGIGIIGTCGDISKVYRTDDYGDNWTYIQDIGTESYVDSILCLDNGVGIIGTYPLGQVWKSTDYGLSWTLKEQFADEGDVYNLSVGEKGTIYASNVYDNGYTYQSVNSGTSWSELAVSIPEIISCWTIDITQINQGVSNDLITFLGALYSSVQSSETELILLQSNILILAVSMPTDYLQLYAYSFNENYQLSEVTSLGIYDLSEIVRGINLLKVDSTHFLIGYSAGTVGKIVLMGFVDNGFSTIKSISDFISVYADNALIAMGTNSYLTAKKIHGHGTLSHFSLSGTNITLDPASTVIGPTWDQDYVLSIDEDHVLIYYQNTSDNTIILVSLSYDPITYIFSEIDRLSFESASFIPEFYGFLKIDTNHYIIYYYTEVGAEGFRVVKTFSVDESYNISEIDSLSSIENRDPRGGSFIQINSTRYLVYYSIGLITIIKTFSLDVNYNITQGQDYSFSTGAISERNPKVVKIDETHFAISYSDGSYGLKIFELNE